MKFRNIIFTSCAALALFASCDRDVNDWEIAKGENRLFKPLIFEASKLNPTAVEIKHTKVIDAAAYVFEFSKDSLFTHIQKTSIILADTLTPFADSNTPMKVEYRTWFDGLDGTTNYWVRMYAENSDASLKSKLSVSAFSTPAEQIFRGVVRTVNSLTLIWEPTDRVTNLVLSKEDQVIEDRALSAEEIADAQAVFTDLEMGTTYVAQIFNADALRGTRQVATSGMSGSMVLQANEYTNGETLSSNLAELVGMGHSDITVKFVAGESYEMIEPILLPTGLKNISFVGEQDVAGNLSWLSATVVNIESEVVDVVFENLKITSGGAMLFNIDKGGKFNDVIFDGCQISEVNSVARMAGGAVANSININNCLISKTGGWGMLNVGSGNTISSINVTNSTLTEINTRFADVRVKTDIVFRNITCCNINQKMGHLWYLDNKSAPSVTIESCIIAGPNGGQKLHSTNGNYGNIPISYGGSYRTNDLVEDSRPLTDITVVNLDIYGLFADPANGDFSIKPGAGFAGTGVAGDPRWF